MEICVIGINHITTPIEIRERIAFNKQKLPIALRGICNLSCVKECIILSTCNRVEIISVVDNISQAYKAISSYILNFHNISADDIPNGFHSYCQKEAIKYIFRVASSLESMIVGEPQILGQLREAYQAAQEAGTTKLILNMLIPHAIRSAKLTRTETNIAKNAVSISFAAVELAKKIFGEIKDKIVLLIGAGEMSELAAKHLISNGVKMVLVANRTLSRAIELAKDFGGEVVDFHEIEHHLTKADIVITSTGAPHFILKKKDIENALRSRKNRPIFFIDIAVPRDIDPEANKCDNVYLYDIDDLKVVVETNLKEREKEAKKADHLIEHEVDKFIKKWATLDIVPLIINLKSHMDGIRKKELEKALSKMGDLQDGQREILDIMTNAIIKKILHKPIVKLKRASDSDEIESLLKTTKELFDFK